MRKAGFCFYESLPFSDEDLAWLKEPFYSYVQTISHARRRKESIGAYLILSALLEEEKISFHDLRHENGHFVLEGYWISISHTEGGIGVLLSQSNDSLDLERIKAHPRIFERILSQEEKGSLQQASDPIKAWIRCWTMKECLIKQNVGYENLDLKQINTCRLQKWAHSFIMNNIMVQMVEEVPKEHEKDGLLYE